MEHPAAERPGTPTPGLLRLRRRRDWIPAALVTHHSRALVGPSRSGGPPEAIVFGCDLGNPLMPPWSRP